MTRTELLERLAQVIILVPNAAQTTGIILPSFKDVKQFNYDLCCLLHSVPKWLDLGQVSRKTIRQIDHGYYASIVFLNDVNHSRGRSFNAIYISDRCSDEQKSQFVFNLMPALTHGKVEHFSDPVPSENLSTK